VFLSEFSRIYPTDDKIVKNSHNRIHTIHLYMDPDMETLKRGLRPTSADK